MICISVGKCTPKMCISLIRKCSFAEVRIDLLNGNAGNLREEKIGKDDVKMIFSSHKNLIATCHAGKLKESECAELLLEAVAAGAAYVDVEVGMTGALRKKIVGAAKKAKCRVIVSYHNYERTPSEKVLEKMVGKCFACGANMVKIACKANTNYDCLRLISLLDRKGELVVIGMGKKGRVVRVLAPMLGSKIAYVAPNKRMATADGQMTQKELEAAQKRIFA